MRLLIVFLLITATPFLVYSQCEFTIVADNSTGCMKSSSEAVFTELVNTTVYGHTIKKTGNGNAWNGGALSTAGVYNDGFAQTVVAETNKTRVFGLSRYNNMYQNGRNTIDYAVVLNNWGGLEIRESGSYRAYAGFYSNGDTIKIAIEDGTVVYYLNSSVLYQSYLTPSFPLYVDLAFRHNDGTIEDVSIINKTNTTINAVVNQNNSTSTSYAWYKNNIIQSETSSALTLNDFNDGDEISCIANPNSGTCNGMALVSNSMFLYATSSTVQTDFQITATPSLNGCYLYEEDVFWEANEPDNIEIDGGNITKIQGYSTYNGGFYSNNFVHENGYLEFQTGETNTRKMIGLSSHDGGNSESSIEYAFYLESGGYLRIYENGGWRGQFGYYNSNDVFKIAVENEVVKYYKNEDLLYVSNQAPSLPLLADGTSQDIGTTITDAKIANPTEGVFTVIASEEIESELNWMVNNQPTGETGLTLTLSEFDENDLISCSYTSNQVGCGNQYVNSNQIRIISNNHLKPNSIFIEGIANSSGIGVAIEEVVWNPESLANVSNIDNNLTKVQGYNQYNAGGSSLNTVKNNGYFEFTVSETNRTKAIGLSTDDPNFSFYSTDYAMQLASNGRFTIYESGSWRTGNITYSNGDKLRIAVENNTVKYYRNQTLVYTSNVSPQLPLLVDISLSSEGGTVQGAVVANANDGKFISQITGLGSTPTLQWNVNGNPTGSSGEIFSYENIQNNDIITCTVTPDFYGCNSNNQYESNYIRFEGPSTESNWVGNVSSAWNNPSNWSNGVPTSSLSAIIKSGAPHQPIISSPQYVKNVELAANASLSFTNEASLIVYGDLLINGTFNSGNGKVTFNGSGDRKIIGDGLKFNTLILNFSSSENKVQLLSPISITDETLFIKGKIETRDQEVTYLKGSKSRYANSESFIEGRVRKIGNSDFIFPIGKGDNFAPLGISAPSNGTDVFSAEYINEDPNNSGYLTGSQDGSLATVNSCEYWNLERLVGQSAVHVSISYQAERSCGIEDASFLQVLHWNGDKWENMGMSNMEGDNESGTITSQSAIDEFSPFTLGSLSTINPLPIELSSFKAEKVGETSSLSWITETETNNAFFTLERSQDAVSFQEIATLDGAGTSHQKLQYEFTDYHPGAGVNYYRLSQTDFDGNKVFFDIRSLYYDPSTSLKIYPNPNVGTFNIERKSDHRVKLRLIDMLGKIRWEESTDQNLIRVSLSNLSKGVYFLELDDGKTSSTEKVIIQ